MIHTEADLERVLVALADTDESFAEGKAALENAEILAKRVRARIFLTSAGTVAERQAEAEVHRDTVDFDKVLVETIKNFEFLKAKRQTAEREIEVWRSLEASRRQVRG